MASVHRRRPLRWTTLGVGVALLGLISCRDNSGPEVLDRPVALPAVGALVYDLHEYLAPQTFVRGSGAPTTAAVPIGGDHYSHFMEPFVLHVQELPGAPVSGFIRVDGVAVVGPQDLGSPKTDFELEIPVTSTSVLTVELFGRPGLSGVTLSIEAALQPPPVIEVTSPERGAMLMQGTAGTSPVEITGQACHPFFPITHLVINGAEVAVAGTNLCEPFTVTQDSPWGLSIITGFVENARGRTATFAQSYLRSPTYFPNLTTFDPTARVPQAVLVQLNQPVLDDGNRADIDDVATIATRVVSATDFNALLPNPLTVDPDANNDGAVDRVTYGCGFLPDVTNHRTGYRVTRGTFRMGAPSGTITAVPGGLDVEITIEDPELPLSVTGHLDLACLGELSQVVTGRVRADRVVARGTALISLGPGRAVASIQGATVNMVNPVLDINFSGIDFIDFLFDAITNAILGGFEVRIESAFRDVLVNEVPSLVADVLEAPTEAHSGDVSVNGFTLGSEAGLDFLSFSGPAGLGFGRIGMFGQVIPRSPDPEVPAARGPIRVDGALPTFAGSGFGFGVGLKDDLTNQLLWAAWRAGAFRVPDVEALTGISLPGIDLALSTMLPPVAMAGPSGTTQVGVGDVVVDALIDPTVLGGGATVPVNVRLYVSGLVGVTLEHDELGNGLRVVDPMPQVFVQVGTIPGVLVDEAALGIDIAGAVEAALIQLIGGALQAIPLPVMDLSGFPGVPAGTILRLRGATVARQGRYLGLTGSLQ